MPKRRIPKPVSEQTIQERINACEGAMAAFARTFKTDQNRFGEYGRNVREAFDRNAATWTELTGKPKPNIYDY